jgi:hypothetical protein
MTDKKENRNSKPTRTPAKKSRLPSSSTEQPVAENNKPNSRRWLTRLAEIITIVVGVGTILGFFLCRDETQVGRNVVSHEQKNAVTADTYNNNSVTSHGQSGGITAQNITINNYLAPDEKQALNQRLLAKYPRGYAVFGVVDGKPTRTIEGLSFEKDFEIVWTGSEIARLEPNYIDFWPPQIVYRPTRNAALGAFNFRLPREVGFSTPYHLLPSWTNVFLEVLDDKGSFAVLALGFKEPH